MKDYIIVTPQLAVQINSKIEDIANTLKKSSNSTYDLMGGISGELLFWAYYLQYTNNKSKKQLVNRLSTIFDNVNQGFKRPSFARGLAGIGWTVEHLVKNEFVNANTDKIIGKMDDYLHPFMLQFIRNKNFDYLHGALGIGLYYLSRTSSPKSKEYLSDLVDELDIQCTRMENGIAWSSELHADKKLSGYNLSLSHGLASLIVFLGKVFETGIQTKKVSDLVHGAVKYLLHSRNRNQNIHYQFPMWVCESDLESGNHGRLAWCYNDMGISIALWQAGNIFKNEEWKQDAIGILLNTTNLTDINDTNVIDVTLCHGAAGVAHIYNRMYKYTKIDPFKKSASFWFEKSIEMSTFSDGLAGYKMYLAPIYGGWQNDFGLLTGISGIGLSMISAVSEIEPKWDSAFLMS